MSHQDQAVSPPPVGDGWNKSHELATQYAIAGLRTLTLVHGGAVVAILSFAGNAGIERIKPALVANSLIYFAFGLVTALSAMLTSYIAQGHATHYRRRLSNVFEASGTVLVLLSLVLFIGGAMTAQRGFNTASVPLPKAAAIYTCESAVAFIRAQADGGSLSGANNPKTGAEAVKVRGGWVVLPPCK